VGHVELVEAGSLAVCFGNFLDGVRAGGGEAIGEVEFFGDGGDGDLAGGVVDFVYADRGEADGGGDLVAEDCSGGVAEVGVDELSGDDAVTVEGLAWACLAELRMVEMELTVGEMGVRLASIGGGIEPVG